MATIQEEEGPPRKKTRLSFTDHISIIVGQGQNKESFVVREDHICPRSDFFKAACSDRRRNPEASKVVELPQDDSRIFSIYLRFLYDARYSHVFDEDAEEDLTEESGLLKAYILADKLRDISTANSIMYDLIDHLHEDRRSPTCSGINIIANDSAPNSLLRTLLVNYLSYVSSAEQFEEIRNHDAIPRAFICDILIMKAKREEKHGREKVQDVFDLYNFFEAGTCQYTLHSPSHPRCGGNCLIAKANEAEQGAK